MAFAAGEFRRVVETHQRAVYSIALRIVGDAGTAEEVAQDVFLELYRTAQPPLGAEHTRFWLRRVAVHRSTDALRRRARQPEAAAEEWQESLEVGAGEAARYDATFETRVESLLRTLPEPMRVATVLRYGEDMMPEEIARTLGQPVATVKSHLQRALKLLRSKAAITMKEFVR